MINNKSGFSDKIVQSNTNDYLYDYSEKYHEKKISKDNIKEFEQFQQNLFTHANGIKIFELATQYSIELSLREYNHKIALLKAELAEYGLSQLDDNDPEYGFVDKWLNDIKNAEISANMLVREIIPNYNHIKPYLEKESKQFKHIITKNVPTYIKY